MMEIEEEYLILDQEGFPQNLACELSFVSLFREVFSLGEKGCGKGRGKSIRNLPW